VIAGELEERLHHRLVGAVAQHLGAHAAAQHQVEGVHQDRLAGARLAGEDVQAGAEPHLHRVDDGEAGDSQGGQHGRKLATDP
jgi:hypothetical protein